jgi:hypothetical protein
VSLRELTCDQNARRCTNLEAQVTTRVDDYVSSASLRSKILALADYYLYDQVRPACRFRRSSVHSCEAGQTGDRLAADLTLVLTLGPCSGHQAGVRVRLQASKQILLSWVGSR